MLKWLVDNVKGKHLKKKLALNNMEEYWEFMFKDFNHRLELTLLFGTVLGFIFGIGTMLIFFSN